MQKKNIKKESNKNTYSIFIDESGNFSYKDKKYANKDFVAGWVCKNYNNDNLEKAVEKEFSIYSNNLNKNKSFNFLRDIHFYPLHNMNKRNEESITIDSKYAAEIIKKTFNIFEKRIAFSFKSTGNLDYYINRQHSYTEILRSTLFQLLQNKEFDNADKIDIYIASRRGDDEIYGYKDELDKKKYEEVFINERLKELKKVLEKDLFKKIDIKIDSISASKLYGFKFADIICGFINSNMYPEYLSKCNLIEYNLNNGIKTVFNSDINTFYELKESNPIEAFIFGLKILSKDNNKNTIKKSLIELWQNSDNYDKRVINKRIDNYFLEELIYSKNIYSNIPTIEKFIETINSIFKDKFKKIDNIEIKKLMFSLSKYSFICDTHKGVTDNTNYDKCQEILDKYANEIFPNIYLALNERHDLILRKAQIDINSFNFDREVTEIENELKMYKNLLKNKDKDIKDENLAKLEGTLGQIYALSAPLQNSENKINNYYKKAEEFFISDLNHCTEGSKAYSTAIGYLNALYFKMNNNEKLFKFLLEELEDKSIKEKNLLSFKNFNLYNINNISDFKLLHHLYFIALSGKNNPNNIKDFKSFADLYLKTHNKLYYPKCNIIKWTSVIFHLIGNKDKALEILENLNINNIDDSSTFTDYLFVLILKMIKNKIKLELNLADDLNLEKDLNNLDTLNKGIKNKLIKLGILEYKNMNVFDIANILPFYFA